MTKKREKRKNSILNFLKQFWKFLQQDSWSSFIVTLLIAFIIIKFIFFPLLSFVTGTSLPLVIVESCSMYHYEHGFEKIFEQSSVYKEHGIKLEDTKNWIFPDGFSKGDVIFVVGPKNIKVGDVIIFNAGAVHPLIHRVISTDDVYSTKGDNYKTNPTQLNIERKIKKDQIIGKALFRIPLIGWVKLIFFEGLRPPRERGVCN